MAQEPNLPPPFFSPRLLLTGVAVACLTGAGAGLWARPAISERRMPAHALALAEHAAERQLQIVVGEAPPAPLGEPLEVMRADAVAPPDWISIPPPEPEPELQAPAPVPQGLVRVAVVEPEPEPAPPPAAKPKPVKAAAPRAEKAQIAKTKADKPKVEKVAAKKAEPKAKAKIEKPEPKRPEPRLVKVKAEKSVSKAQKAKLEKVRLEKVRLEKSRAEKAKVETARLQQVKLDRAKAARLKAEKAKPPKAQPFAKLMKVKTKPLPEDPGLLDRIEKAVLKVTPPRPAAPRPVMVVKAAPPATPAPAPVAAPRAEEPRLTQVRNRCDADDPADVLVCENPSLQAAERQMARAYRDAEDAGIAPARLRNQQRRWLAARSAAARDNPWAVRDVYEARIEELQDLSRAARGGY